jgi:PH (Pleckstrin Homology) domain-containing protein
VAPFLRSELPVRARTRHHPIVLLRKTHKLTALLLALTVGWAFFSSAGVLALVAELAWILYWRWRIWRAEWIFLTGKRVIRIQGIPETTSAEASLRIDRVSGARLVQTPLGKIFDYGTIELEAPGEHPDVRKLRTIDGAERFYIELRSVVFGEDRLDPDDFPEDYITAPLPDLPDERHAPRGLRHPRDAR